MPWTSPPQRGLGAGAVPSSGPARPGAHPQTSGCGPCDPRPGWVRSLREPGAAAGPPPSVFRGPCSLHAPHTDVRRSVHLRKPGNGLWGLRDPREARPPVPQTPAAQRRPRRGDQADLPEGGGKGNGSSPWVTLSSPWRRPWRAKQQASWHLGGGRPRSSPACVWDQGARRRGRWKAGRVTRSTNPYWARRSSSAPGRVSEGPQEPTALSRPRNAGPASARSVLSTSRADLCAPLDIPCLSERPGAGALDLRGRDKAPQGRVLLPTRWAPSVRKGWEAERQQALPPRRQRFGD